VFFEPSLPGLCDLSDAGFKPDTPYRVQVIGNPEEFAVRNLSGQPLNSTTTHEFRTRPDQDPNLFTNQDPSQGPGVTPIAPLDGAQAVGVAPSNAIELSFTENLDPCSVNQDSVTLKMYETGDMATFDMAPNGNMSGFISTDDPPGDANTEGTYDNADQTPGDPYTWGAANTTRIQPEPQTIPVTLELVQTFHETMLYVRPVGGAFPENALLVLELTFDVEDFGAQPLVPFVMSFTTENLPLQNGSYLVENEGETPWIQALSTARINDPDVCPSRVQGFLLFSGDGDNGSTQQYPTAPEYNAPNCDLPRDVNNAEPDHFNPQSNAVLDTGPTQNLCTNEVDGSTAVVWEFASFRIGPNIRVDIIGVNPAIILVQGDVIIESGGMLNLAGGNGRQGKSYPSGQAKGVQGGTGVAGGGEGGDSYNAYSSFGPALGQHGQAGFGSPNQYAFGGHGAGHGNAAVGTSSYTSYPSSGAGGGGGHGTAGGDGGSNLAGGGVWKTAPDGKGGDTYPTGGGADELLTPSAGSGGGAAGWATGPYDSYYYRVSGGSAGAGGGFVDITSSGNIRVYGTIDARGGRGGDGNLYYINRPYTGGGGGGAGGGVRLLTPFDIDVSGGTIDTSGGPGGAGSFNNSYNPTPNDGGPGGNGRIVLEDGDSVITGIGNATLVPGEGATGFYRGIFNATRFAGGGKTPVAISDLFQVGPFDPLFIDPVQSYGGQEDFIAGIPDVAAGVPGDVRILIEARGYDMKRDGTPEDTPTVGWHTVGHFTSSGISHLPTFVLGQVPPALRPTDNVDFGLTNLNGCEFLQIRVTFFLPDGVGPLDAGPYLDDWTIRFSSDQ
jgi:hypothetical protein